MLLPVGGHDILAEEIQIFLLEELHRIDTIKLRKDIVPQVAAAYYSGGIIQILLFTGLLQGDSLSEELLVKQEKSQNFQKIISFTVKHAPLC